MEVEASLANNNLTDVPEGNTTESGGGGANVNRQKQSDLSGAIRKDGETAEADSDRALGGLEAEGGQAVDRGEAPTVGGTQGRREGVRGDQGADGKRVPKPRSGGSGNAKVHNPQAGETGKGRTRKDSQPGGSSREKSAPATIPASSNVITEEVGLGQGGETVKFNDNIAAIKTLKTLQGEQRHATAEEAAGPYPTSPECSFAVIVASIDAISFSRPSVTAKTSP